MSTRTNKEQQKQPKSILAKDVNQAVRQLIAISQDLIRFADTEAQALVTLDHMKFAFAQRDKELMSEHYALASEEFRERLGAFRMADKNLIAHLNTLQNELKEKTEHNNVMIDQIKTKAAANTQATLFTVQQMGQRVYFGDQDRAGAQERKEA
tara:strand:+ start:37498 stop:37956 length:459 start_codon:yes stop_codon:yes gene_type:complete